MSNVERPTTQSLSKETRPNSNLSRADKSSRPKRVRVSGWRDVLTVTGKDPNYVYRWVRAPSERAQRILRFLQAGYEFVTQQENLDIGEDYISKTDSMGTLYRVPSGTGDYLYLMKILREYYEEDQKSKEQDIQSVEEGLRKAPDSGFYGEVKF